jgi:hypothetical protein
MRVVLGCGSRATAALDEKLQSGLVKVLHDLADSPRVVARDEWGPDLHLRLVLQGHLLLAQNDSAWMLASPHYGSKMEPSNSSLVSSDQWAARSQQLIATERRRSWGRYG